MTWVRHEVAPELAGCGLTCRAAPRFTVPEPNLDGHVFCRVVEDKGDIEIDECVTARLARTATLLAYWFWLAQRQKRRAGRERPAHYSIQTYTPLCGGGKRAAGLDNALHAQVTARPALPENFATPIAITAAPT